MHRVHLSSIDLNLLVVLDALLVSPTLTAAARKVGLSQSATSHALARLRVVLADPLFERDGRRLLPTARALALRGPLRQALATLERSLASPTVFEPLTASRTFHLATADYAELVLLPPLVARVAREAPLVDVWARPWDGNSAELAKGDTELVVAPLGLGFEPGPAVHRRALFEERFVCVARRGNPRLKKRPVSLEAWLALPHVLIAPSGRRGGVVDDALRVRGLERRIAVAVPHFLVAPHIVAQSDLVLTVAERVARTFAQHLALSVFPPPLPVAGFKMGMFWHERLDADPGLAWLRATMLEVAGAL